MVAGEAGPELSRNAQVLLYFVLQFPGATPRRLMYLSYLADLEARKLLGAPITTFEYHAE